MSIILKKVRSRLRCLELVHEISCDSDCQSLLPNPFLPLSEASYVDDVVLPLVAAASDLVDMVAAAAAVVVGVFRDHFLTVNFSKGKTEALLNFHGHGAKLHSRRLHYELGNTIPVAMPDGSNISLRCVSRYKHVGSHTIFAGDDRAE
eukprot:10878774-Karenia_brevis.AAC.1